MTSALGYNAIKLRLVSVHDKDGASEKATLATCGACGSDQFHVFQIERQDHPHLQCVGCDTSYCSRKGGCNG